MHTFGESLFIQPAYRFQYSLYTEGGSTVGPGAGREDYYHTLSLTVGRYFTKYVCVRAFGSAEFRNSSPTSRAWGIIPTTTLAPE